MKLREIARILSVIITAEECAACHRDTTNLEICLDCRVVRCSDCWPCTCGGDE